MISKFLKSKNIINMVRPLIDEDELSVVNAKEYYLKNYNNNGLFYYYSDLFKDNELNKIISICNRIPEVDALVSTNNDLEIQTRISKLSWVPVNNVTEWIYQRLTDCINYVNSEYFKFDLEKIEMLQFTKYYGNTKSFYKPHLDTIYNNVPHDRKLSFVLQLSDPSEYEGGELRLHLSKTPQIIEKKKGLITFFPSNVLHECTPITKGTRYVLVGWVIGPRFK